MLTKFEVQEYYKSLVPHFVRKRGDKIIHLYNKRRYHALMEKGKFGRIVGVSASNLALNSAKTNDMDIRPTLGINKDRLDKTRQDANYVGIDFSLNDCWKWKLTSEDGTLYFWKEDYGFNSYEELYNIILINQKISLFTRAISAYMNYKKELLGDLYMQKQVYFEKYIQAQHIIKNNIIDDDILDDYEYPYVSNYAREIGEDVQSAAKKILIQHDNWSAKSADYENFRMKYNTIIKEETDIKLLPEILKMLQLETTVGE